MQATIAPSKPQLATAKKAPSVNAKVQYVKPAPNGEDLFIYLYEKPENVDRVTNIEHIETEVPFTDLRTIENQSGEFTIERNGFQLDRLHVPSDVDWDSDKDVSMHICLPELRFAGLFCSILFCRKSTSCIQVELCLHLTYVLRTVVFSHCA